MKTCEKTFFLSRYARMKSVHYIAAVILIVFLSVYAFKCIKDNQENDFSIFYHAAEEALGEADLYSVDGYLYPPSAALLLSPLLFLGLKSAAATWFFLNIVLLWSCVLLSIYLVFRKISGLRFAYYILPVLLVLRPVDSNFTNGQINLIILFIVLLGIAFFQRRKDLLSGFIISIAISVKLTPLVFLPYFLYKRAYLAAIGMLIGLSLFMGLLPALLWGPDRTVELMKQNVEFLSRFPENGDPTGYVSGHSAQATLLRLLTRSNVLPSRYANKPFYPMHVNIMNLDRSTITHIGRVLFVILALAMVWLLRTDATDRKDPALSMECALILLAMLMISPLSRKAHFVSMIYPFALTVCFWTRFQSYRLFRRLILFSLVICFVLNNFPASGLVGRRLSLFLNAFSPLFFSSLLSFVTISLMKIRLERERPHTTLVQNRES